MSETPVSLLSALKYDGFHLGSFEFNDVVKWSWPCTKTTSGLKTVTLYVMLKLSGWTAEIPVILKRNCAAGNDQIVIDELKPLFGLRKMGTHRIRLHGIPRRIQSDLPWILETTAGNRLNVALELKWSEYFVFRACTYTDKLGKMTFVQYPKLQDTPWVPSVSNEIKEGHRKFFFEIQKILIFRELLRVSDTNLTNILVRINPHKKGSTISPLSVDEMTIKNASDNYRKIPEAIEKFFFSKLNTKTEVIIRMLGLTKEDYTSQVETLRNAITQIIIRIDENRIGLVDDVINNIIDRVTLYYRLKDD